MSEVVVIFLNVSAVSCQIVDVSAVDVSVIQGFLSSV